MLYSASRREKAGSVSLIAPLASQARLITFRVLAGPSFTLSDSRAPATSLFSIAHTLLFLNRLQLIHSRRFAHSFKNTGGVPLSFPKRNSLQRPGSVVIASPSRRIQMCLYLGKFVFGSVPIRPLRKDHHERAKFTRIHSAGVGGHDHRAGSVLGGRPLRAASAPQRRSRDRKSVV